MNPGRESLEHSKRSNLSQDLRPIAGGQVWDLNLIDLRPMCDSLLT